MFHKVPFSSPLDGPVQSYSKENFLSTPTGNRISPVGHKIIGLAKIMVSGKTIIEPNVTVRADIQRINIGSYCIVCENAVLKPSDNMSENSNAMFVPLVIGDCVVIGRSSVVRASQVGSYSYISENCVVDSRCVIESCTMLEPNTVLASGTVVPPFCVFGGNPGKCVGKLPPSFRYQIENHCKDFYQKFVSERQFRDLQEQNKKDVVNIPE